jgi:pyridoxine 5-phosphate synthase
MKLLVNIDHVATLRNARGEGYPDPVEAAHICEQAGAAGIVFHLRGDRRHIRDEDVYKLKKQVRGKLDFEMAATDEMLEICTDVAPHLCTLVPEGREELTTEGGLKMESVFDDFKQRVFPALRKTNTEISLFLDPNPEDIRLAHELGTDVIELHTGTYANADAAKKKHELIRLRKAAKMATDLGIKASAGHGLNLQNLPDLLETIPNLYEVSIGHALVSRALYWGLEKTVKAYLDILEDYA